MGAVLTIGIVASFIAGLTQSSLGFGMALILAPCIMLAVEPSAVVPIVVLMSTVNTFLTALHARGQVQWRLLLPLLCGGLPGMTAGIHLLSTMDGDGLRLAVGVLVLLFTALFWGGVRKPLPERAWTAASVGLTSGLLGGATSISGPPVALFLANQNTPRDVFRANLVSYFFVLDCYAIARFFMNGMLTHDVALYSLAFLPATLAGTALGLRYGHRLPEHLFRRLVYLLLVTMGTLLIVNSLVG